MVVLFQNFNQDSQRLYESINKIEFKANFVCLNETGYLPNNTETPYSYYCKMDSNNEKLENSLPKAAPLFFNQLKVPKYWNIESDMNSGKVFDKSRLKAKIYYATPNSKRRISGVAWYGNNKNVLYYDHYDKHGFRFAKTIVDNNEKPVMKQWFSKIDNSVVIEENLVTNSMFLNKDDKQLIFHDLVDFYIYYLIEKKYNLECILYNSLHYPHFISERLASKYNINGSDFLFWQEQINDDIPGNMKCLVNGTSKRLCHAIVQNHKSYEKMVNIYGEADWFSYLGYILPDSDNKQKNNKVLIVTNSDSIEHIDDIVDRLSSFEFTICSITTMSEKLLALNSFQNVQLLPTVSFEDITNLRKECLFYLDINHFGEVYNSLYDAILNDQIVMSFTNTVHNNNLVLDDMIFQADDWSLMCDKIKTLSVEKKSLMKYKQMQNLLIDRDSIENYHSVFDAIAH